MKNIFSFKKFKKSERKNKKMKIKKSETKTKSIK